MATKKWIDDTGAGGRAFPFDRRFVKGMLFLKTQFQNHYMNESVLRAWLFFLKDLYSLRLDCKAIIPLNTFSGIMALQERNEVNNYEHYKCGEKI